VGTAELGLAGPGQHAFAGAFEPASAAGVSAGWIAFPAGRRARHAGAPPSMTLCLVLQDGGAAAQARLEQARALAPEDGEILALDAGSRDWTLSRCLRAAVEDERVVVLRAPAGRGSGELVADALVLASAPLVLIAGPDVQLLPDAVAVLSDALTAAPAAVAAVAGVVRQRPGDAPVAGPPWSGAGYVAGPDAVAAALTASEEALATCPALVRTDALEPLRCRGIRDVLLGVALAGDVVGVPQALAVGPGADPHPRPAGPCVAAAVRTADLVAGRSSDRLVLAVAARALAAELAGAPALAPADLALAAGALGRLGRAAADAGTGAVDVRGFRPGLVPLPLVVRTFTILCRFAWSGAPPAGLEGLLQAYLEVFDADRDVSLLLAPVFEGDAGGASLEGWLVGLITGRLGRTLEDIPDILVEVAPLDPDGRAALIAVADCVAIPKDAGSSDVLEALACGLAVLGAPDGWVTEATGFPGTDDDLGSRLRAAAADPAGCAARGARGRARVLRNST